VWGFFAKACVKGGPHTAFAINARYMQPNAAPLK
jgi:hypothetical protein